MQKKRAAIKSQRAFFDFKAAKENNTLLTQHSRLL